MESNITPRNKLTQASQVKIQLYNRTLDLKPRNTRKLLSTGIGSCMNYPTREQE